MESSATNYKISWFKNEEASDNLILSPKFQRKSVWSEEQSSFLIDSILNELPIPEIYIRSSSSPDGNTKYEVVDGQQRLRSIIGFYSNDFELKGDDVGADLVGSNFDDLSDKQKTKFWGYKIVVRDVSGATDIEIRDLFKRLNINSVVLNDQELRHAEYSGKFIKTMETIADDEWWLDNRIVNVRQVRRMEDVEYISELFIAMIAGPQDKKSTIDDFYDAYDSAMPKSKEWMRRFQSIRDLIEEIIGEDELRKWSGKSDFYTLFLAFNGLIGKKLTSSAMNKIAKKLSDFRSDVDSAKRKDNDNRFSSDVHAYAEAVTRAATDIGRRAARLQVLEKLIGSALGTGKVSSK